MEEKIQTKEREVAQLKEFYEKNVTNFVRNVRPRLCSLFPNVYKGKEGNQKLLRDVRYLKISCERKIPPVTKDDMEKFEKLISEGKGKVVETTGLRPESDNPPNPRFPNKQMLRRHSLLHNMHMQMHNWLVQHMLTNKSHLFALVSFLVLLSHMHKPINSKCSTCRPTHLIQKLEFVPRDISRSHIIFHIKITILYKGIPFHYTIYKLNIHQPFKIH